MFTKARGVAASSLALGVADAGRVRLTMTSERVTTAGRRRTSRPAAAGSGLKPINEGKLTVGMNLQFKPQMYLETQASRPGYDVDLLKLLAPTPAPSSNIQNLDFNGLIPGLQSEEVRHGLGRPRATPERKKVVDFTRGVRPVRAGRSAVPADKAASVTSRGAAQRGRHDDHGAAGLDRGAARARRRSRTPRSKSASPTRTRRSSRSQPAGPTGSSSRTTCSRSSTSPTATSWSRPRSASRCTSSTARRPCRRATRPSSRTWTSGSARQQTDGTLEENYKKELRTVDATAADAGVLMPERRDLRPPGRRRRPGGARRRGRGGGGRALGRPRRRAGDARRPDLQAARPGLRGPRPEGARSRLRPRPAADRGGRALRRADHVLDARSWRSRATAVVLVADGERARTVTARRAAARAGRARPPGRLPGLDAAGRDDRRRRADARQDPARASRPAHRLRGQRPARARLPGAAARLRRRTSTLVLEAGPAAARRPTSLRLLARGARQRDPAARRRRLPRRAAAARACRCATGGSSCAPRATGRVESVVHARVDADWRVVAGHARRRSRRMRSASATASSRRSSCCGSPAATSPTTRTSAARSSIVDEWMRTTVDGVLAAGRRDRRRRLVRRDRRGPARGARRRAGPRRALAADAPSAAAAPIRARIAAKRALRRGAAPHAPRRPGDLRARRRARPSSAAARRSRARELDEAVEATDDLSVVKGLTRAGMGLCQGRNCQRQVAALIARAPRHGDRRPSRPRRRGCPPGRCALGAIARAPDDDPGLFQ